jgi:predicted phage baseplate assembly protein
MSGCGCTGALPCGCCEGVTRSTPASVANRPGLPALRYRVGTHRSFMETMTAALSGDRRLDGLSSRDTGDASLALLDAWATIADVLTFYQERIANEGYLATATERRSVLELAGLVGYRPRPGVAASTLLAYTLDDGARATIPAGALVRSVPADGETQQAFETSEPLDARAAWNALRVRRARPHTRESILAGRAVHLQGVATGVRVGDGVFVVFGPEDAALCRVLEVQPDAASDRTRLGLEEWTASGRFPIAVGSPKLLADRLRRFLRIDAFGLRSSNATVRAVLPLVERIVDTLDAGDVASLDESMRDIRALTAASPPRSARAQTWVDELLAVDASTGDDDGKPTVTVDDVTAGANLLVSPSLAPRSQYHRGDDVRALIGADPDSTNDGLSIAGATVAALTAFRPAYREALPQALAEARVTEPSAIRVLAVIRAAPFGHNASPRATSTEVTGRGEEGRSFSTSWAEWPLDPTADADADEPVRNKLDLDREIEGLDRHPLVAIQTGVDRYAIERVTEVTTVSRAAYGLAGKATRLLFEKEIFEARTGTLGVLRPIAVHLAGRLLPLADEPIDTPVCGEDRSIELDGFYDGLTPGKWMILSGERQDTPGTSGVRATELLLIGDVQHGVTPGLPGDRLHTFLTPVVASAFCYRRDTVRIYGNVVKATQGETRREVLGSGDAAVPFQTFALKQSPVTFVAAANATGVESSLHVYVNDVEWHEAAGPVGLTPADRRFFTATADDGVTTVTFGNGQTGARLPTGTANLRATYRNGLGRGGNLAAGQLSIPGLKPYGVKEVVNPLPASGGADRDSRDQIRANAPLAVTALDRLVSIRDYEHFARTFAGIGKASAVALSDGRRRVVHVTIAGLDDIPIEATSDLLAALRRALRLLGDAGLPVQVQVRVARFLVLQAGVKVHPDYPWETVAPRLRAALADAFHFDRRELGQPAFLSEVLDVLQRVPGVEFVDVDVFGSITEAQLTPSAMTAAIAALTRAEVVTARLAHLGGNGIDAGEIAYVRADVPATVALNPL